MKEALSRREVIPRNPHLGDFLGLEQKMTYFMICAGSPGSFLRETFSSLKKITAELAKLEKEEEEWNAKNRGTNWELSKKVCYAEAEKRKLSDILKDELRAFLRSGEF